MASLPTVWVLGDQLNRAVASLAGRRAGDCRVLMVESEAKIRSKPWHAQRLHLVLSAMRHFAAELRAEGFDVDYRSAPSLSKGVAAHRRQFDTEHVIAMEPMSWDARAMLVREGVGLVPNDQFLCDYRTFASWAEDRKRLTMEDFYRWQRARLDLLMVGDEPTGGRWNLDADNRKPPPRDGRAWPPVARFSPDEIDRELADHLSARWGSPPDGTWPVTRQQALVRLQEFVEHGLSDFGPYEDAMLGSEWRLSHSTLSSSMNLGLLHPEEVVRAVIEAYEEGAAPLSSAEGFVRQVIGWREFVWGLYWLYMPEYRELNGLGADGSVPPSFTGQAATAMACVAGVTRRLQHHGYAHHIERLMVLGNLALTAGVSPQAMTDWMWASFVDGAEWVMVPNVIGMALHADDGRMATKPYASGGAYVNRMSDFCRECRFDPRKRVGEDACPFTSLYWDFLARNEEALRGNHRMSRQLASMRRLGDLDEVRRRANQMRSSPSAGTL